MLDRMIGWFGYALRERIAYAWLDGPVLPAGTRVAVQHLGRHIAATEHDTGVLPRRPTPSA